MPNLCNYRGQWAENMGKGKCCFGFWRASPPVHYRKASVTGDPQEA